MPQYLPVSGIADEVFRVTGHRIGPHELATLFYRGFRGFLKDDAPVVGRTRLIPISAVGPLVVELRRLGKLPPLAAA